MPGFAETNRTGEAGAVVLRPGSRYITVASVPAPDSLEVMRIEKLRTEWLHSGAGLEVGDTLQLPLTYRDGGGRLLSLYVEETTLPPAAREVWQSYEQDDANNYTSLRRQCSDHGLDVSATPSTEEMVDALMEAGISPPAPSAKNNVEQAVMPSTETQEVSYTPVELYEGIEEADGAAAEEALGMLEGQVDQYLKKRAVVEDYLTIGESGSPFEEVRDVADEHEVHWRTVHRYVDDLLDDEERILSRS